MQSFEQHEFEVRGRDDKIKTAVGRGNQNGGQIGVEFKKIQHEINVGVDEIGHRRIFNQIRQCVAFRFQIIVRQLLQAGISREQITARVARPQHAAL